MNRPLYNTNKNKSHEYFLVGLFIIVSLIFVTAPVLAEDNVIETNQTIIDEENNETREEDENVIEEEEEGDEEIDEIEEPEDVNEIILTGENKQEENENIAEENINVNLNLRYQNNLIFSDTVEVPSSTIIIDSTDTVHFTTSTDVLTALISADEMSEEFNIKQLDYYESWGSFYLKCIEIYTPTTTELCDNWNYVVNGNYPSVGMDSYNLEGEENIYIYFDNPWKITASTSTFELGTTTTLETWRYNYDNLEEEWITDPENMVGISIDNPEPTGWWDATLSVDTTTTDQLGSIDYLFNTTGTYYAKIISDDWTKWSNPITLTVTDVAEVEEGKEEEEQEEEAVDPPSPGGCGGACATPPQKNDLELMIDNAFEYLYSEQEDDGGFGALLFTDWVAMAFGKYNFTENAFVTAKNELKNYISTVTEDDLTYLTDFERHTLARAALNEEKDKYKQKILDEFDGNQFGDEGLDNDDIFAILSLCEIGYCTGEVLTAAENIRVDFVSSSFYGTDLTAAATRALLQVYTNSDESISNAKEYLQSEQDEDAGFKSTNTKIDSTSWVMDTIGELGDTEFDGWTKQNKTPLDYLTQEQNGDGSFGQNNKIWSTSYALIALSYDWSLEPGEENNVDDEEDDTTDDNNSDDSTSGNYTDTTDTTSTTTSTPDITTSTSTNPIVTTTLNIIEDIEIIDDDEPEETPVIYIPAPTFIPGPPAAPQAVSGEKIDSEEGDEDNKLETGEGNDSLEIGLIEDEFPEDKEEKNNKNSLLALIVGGGIVLLYGAWKLVKALV